jgi:hypothetical protein
MNCAEESRNTSIASAQMLMLWPEPKEWLEEDSWGCFLFTGASVSAYLDIGNGNEKTTAKRRSQG